MTAQRFSKILVSMPVWPPTWRTYIKAVFTLGRNMISLITNETCLVMKSVHIRQCIARIMVDYSECD